MCWTQTPKAQPGGTLAETWGVQPSQLIAAQDSWQLPVHLHSHLPGLPGSWSSLLVPRFPREGPRRPRDAHYRRLSPGPGCRKHTRTTAQWDRPRSSRPNNHFGNYRNYQSITLLENARLGYRMTFMTCSILCGITGRDLWTHHGPTPTAGFISSIYF